MSQHSPTVLDEYYSLPVSEIIEHPGWDIPIISKDEPLINVLKVLSTNDHIWVVESRTNKNIVGIITEYDIIKSLTPPELHTYNYGNLNKLSLYHIPLEKAKHFTNHKIISCTISQTVRDVIITLLKYQFRRLPAIDDGDLVGEVTIHSLTKRFLDMLISQDQQPLEKSV